MPVLQPIDFLASHGRSFPAWNLEDSRRYARDLARSHYENFFVTALLLPSRLRQDYFNVYAYCRWADDLADETGDPERSADLLAWWRGELQAMGEGRAFHPVFVALRDTAERHALPLGDFDDLLQAFVQDQSVLRYATFDDVLQYCRYSANPVGRMVLRINGCRDESLFALSDAICTALQLANHWQDVQRDWAIGRAYMPEDVMRANGYSYELLADDISRGTAREEGRRTIRSLVDRTAALFARGRPLADRFGGRLGLEIDLFAGAGMAVLDRIRAQSYDTIANRPTISGFGRAVLAFRVAARRVSRRSGVAPDPNYVGG